jgi:energy-coupling factor transporter ATP-binding protein EcfA2/ABC-type transport system involved in multi-copper enzyme maturation permease subunit
MKDFCAFFVAEFKRLFSAKVIVALMLLLLLCLYFVQEGIQDYKDIADSKVKFQEIEKVKVGQYTHYRQYGSYGFRLLFIPSPLSVFFTNSGVAAEITSQVDSGEILKIYNSIKGKNLFSEKKDNFKDFSGIILLFGSLMALYFGYSSFRYRDYLRFLSGFSGFKPIFCSILASRILIMLFFFLFLIVAGSVLLVANGIPLGGPDYIYLLKYSAVMLLMLLFFYILGTAVGSLKSKAVGVVTLMVLWFVSVFLLPGIISKLVSKRAGNITLNYQLELKKLKTLMSFEQESNKKYGTLPLGEKMSEEAKGAIESYLRNEFVEINKMEKGMIEEMNDNVRFYHRLASFFPATFYQSVHNEVSSRGYKNFIDFYHYVHDLKKRFVRFFIEKSYYTEHPENVESFIEGDENIFYAGSRLPDYAWTGVSLTILLCVILLIVSYLCCKRFLFKMVRFDSSTFMKKLPPTGKLNLKVRKGESYVLLSAIGGVGDQLYVLYSGAVKGFKNWDQIQEKFKIMADDQQNGDFVFVGKTAEWPGNIKVGDFLNLMRRLTGIDKNEADEISILLGIDNIKKKYFGAAQESEKRQAVFAAAKMKNSKYYIFDDFASGMPVEFIIEFSRNIRRLKESGKGILYLSNDVLLAPEIGDRIGIMKGGQLLFDVKDSELRQMNLNQVYFQYFANGE